MDSPYSRTPKLPASSGPSLTHALPMMDWRCWYRALHPIQVWTGYWIAHGSHICHWDRWSITRGGKNSCLCRLLFLVSFAQVEALVLYNVCSDKQCLNVFPFHFKQSTSTSEPPSWFERHCGDRLSSVAPLCFSPCPFSQEAAWRHLGLETGAGKIQHAKLRMSEQFSAHTRII